MQKATPTIAGLVPVRFASFFADPLFHPPKVFLRKDTLSSFPSRPTLLSYELSDFGARQPNFGFQGAKGPVKCDPRRVLADGVLLLSQGYSAKKFLNETTIYLKI